MRHTTAGGAVTGTARHRDLATLSTPGPVHHDADVLGAPAWVITGYQANREVLQHPGIVRAPGAHLRDSPHRKLYPDSLLAGIDQHLLGTNPPHHTRLRRLTSGVLRQRSIDRFAPRVAAAVIRLLDDLPSERTRVDLVSAYGNRVPIAVMAELFDIPPSDRDNFARRCDVLGNAGDHSTEVFVAAASAVLEQLRSLFRLRRAHPGDDLLSDLASARVGNDRLTDDELTSMAYALIVAGHETTANLITVGTYNLLASPSQLELLRADPSRIDRAVEELLRFDGPLQAIIPCITTEAIEIDGVTIPAGEVVLPAVLAANRDPARFDEADRLDVTRDASRHLAFGHGIHRCVGAPIGRLSGRAAIGALIARFPRLRLAQPDHEPTRRPGPLMNGLVDLPVRLH